MRVLNAPLSRSWQIVAAILLLMCTGFAYAQSNDSQSDAGDPPARVARISFASGDLGLMPAGSTNWSAADINRPLTNGDKLSSGPGARAELDLGGAVLRIDGQSDIGVLNLNGQTDQFELTEGTLNITVRSLDQGSTYEIDTPTLALVIDQAGSFRLDVPSDGNATTVTVNDGLATVYGENNAQREIYSGRRYQFNESSLNDVTVTDTESSDAFDAWCSNRDGQESNETSAQYVSDDMVGGDDLDGWGSWEENEDYGAIWYPINVGIGWAPYRFGHWVWISPWGWTWVDNLPWGFAPYHYGRWAFIGHRWGWIPGPRHLRPIYAPALVAFVGTGAGRPLGWFPLGPRDVYSPWYRASRNYYTGVNLANIGVGRYYDQTSLINTIRNQYGFYQGGRTAPGATYAYRNTPNALTAVSAQTFANARSVQNSQVHLNPQQVAAASVITPSALQRPAASSFGQPRLVNARPLPSAAFNRQVVAVGKPAAAVAATASFRAGQPASHVRVLTVSPGAVNHVQAPDAQVVRQVSVAPNVETQSSPRPATLPQVPRFEPAQQVQQVAPTPQRYTPTAQSYSQHQENPEQARFEAAQRSHEYVPEQRQPETNPAPQSYREEPSQQSYARPDYPRPEQQERPEQEAHPQNAPKPPSHESAPSSRQSANQH